MNATGSGNQLKGTGYKQVTTNNFTPEQTKLFQSMFSQLGGDSFLNKLSQGDESTFNQIEAPKWRDFNAGIGNLSSRFSGMGDFGARRSSGFQNAGTSAASNFAQDLGSRRQALQQQAMKDLFGMQESLLNQRPYENSLIPEMQKQPGFLEKLLGSLLGGASQVGSSYFGRRIG